jgi:hypothetical protein
MSLKTAAISVLEDTGRPMKVKDLWGEIERRELHLARAHGCAGAVADAAAAPADGAVNEYVNRDLGLGPDQGTEQ